MNVMASPVEQVPVISREQAAVLAAVENERIVALMRSLTPEDWTKPTDCPAWDVKAMACHILGAMEGNVSLRQFVHQLRAGKQAAGDRPDIDGMTEVQVRERIHLSPRQVVEGLTAMGPKAARARAKTPGPVRRLPFKVEVATVMETWRLGYLFDTIMTRDTWMHRVDIARATGHLLELTADHDGRIVADVVVEWARRHGQPFTLHLTGPAGGTFTHGVNGDQLTLEAVEFCRTLSGRTPGTGLLAQPVPF